MNNVQKHYLIQLESASEIALQGNVQGCLDICFELRLKPDLAFYTRVLVDLTICDLVDCAAIPEKLDIAKDALRLAKELQESDDEHKDAFWTAEYERLVKHATRAVERARSEEELLHEELRQAQSQEIEDAEADMGGFRLITDDEVGGSFEQENEVVDEPRADVDFSRMIEHAFTLYPARLLGGNAAKPMVTMQDDETIPVHEALGSSHSSASEGIALPLLPKETGAGDMMQLPIPLPSSRQASEAHDEENMYME